ncbi:Metallo-hydrolase/oxidoreductase [Daedaleopsis nitida]|nr:Metallo-hydrolase/oxidoreductase [Daedaleopsis nitida]
MREDTERTSSLGLHHTPRLARRSLSRNEEKVVWKDVPPAHHVNKDMTRFRNPWPSFRCTLWLMVGTTHFFFTGPFSGPKIPKDLAARIPSQNADWGAGQSPEGVKTTWLGHACFLVELPTPEGATRGPRILFDPCSTPCAAEDVPEVDALVISTHMDLDFPTLRTIYTRHRPHVFAPLGNAPHLAAAGIPLSHIHVLDWWEESAVSVALPSPPASPSQGGNGPSEGAVNASFVLTCTPAQHTSGRSAFDRWRTLWASWAVEEDFSDPPLPTSAPGPVRAPRKVFFAGDTGYRTVLGGENEDAVPCCPAFKEVGEKFGGFDLALLPIGAYAPRSMWSGLHASPRDAVQIYKDVGAKRAIGMHWGTWALTTESPMESPEMLRRECENAGLDERAFTVCGLGETSVI